MIPRAYLQEWSARAPWPDLRQVEQDLIICRALCDLFKAPKVRGRIAFRGGTAINKLLFRQPLRYSEDIDLVDLELPRFSGHVGAWVTSGFDGFGCGLSAIVKPALRDEDGVAFYPVHEAMFAGYPP